jgi:hypothetical protein
MPPDITNDSRRSISDEVFLAPDSFNRTYGQIVAIPRDDIVRIAFAEQPNFRAAGARDPRALLDASEGSPEGLRGDVEEYFAAWAGDPRWKYPPLLFLESGRAVIVVASGSLAVSSGSDVQGAFMQCSAARRPLSADRPKAPASSR